MPRQAHADIIKCSDFKRGFPRCRPADGRRRDILLDAMAFATDTPLFHFRLGEIPLPSASFSL